MFSTNEKKHVFDFGMDLHLKNEALEVIEKKKEKRKKSNLEKKGELE